MKLKLVWEYSVCGFYNLEFWIGSSLDQLEYVGTLMVIQSDKAKALRLVLCSGIDPRTGIDGIFESGWKDEEE